MSGAAAGQWRRLALPPVSHGSAFLLGAASVLGFAPFNLFPVPILTLAGLYWLWLRGPGTMAGTGTGFAFGLGLFGAGASWIYVSLHDFGAMPAPLAGLATFVFCALMALFPAGVGWLQARFPVGPIPRFIVFVPAVWTLVEWSRTWVFTGFPWLAMGYSQVPSSPLAGFAPVLGIFGVSLAVAMSSGLLTLALDGDASVAQVAASAPRRWPWIGLFGALWVCGLGLNQVQWTQPRGDPTRVSLLQGDIAQDLKWRPERALATLDTYLQLARESTGKLVILPETALPLFLHEVPPEYLDALAARAKAAGGDTLVGIPELAGPRTYYNSMFSIGSSPVQRYRKHHLVPFGEFIPLRPVFGWVMGVLDIPLSDFSRGPAVQAPLAVAGQKVALDICYEDVFGEEVIRQLPEATLLANVSNDAWFGRSLGPQQHLQISQARALETGRYMVRATNTGVTAIIDARGHTVKRAPEFRTTRLEGEIQGYAGATPFVRWGNAALVLLAGTMMLAALVSARAGSRR
jgi:apolipoprotein N-acyltransferase